MKEGCYQKKFRAYLEDTSAYGNVYYFTYHHWVALAKESFFLDKAKGFSNLFKQYGIKLFVLRSSLKIYGETKIHDEVVVTLSCILLKKLKAHLLFKCYNINGEQIAESENVIAFVDSQNKIMPIPDDIRKALKLVRNQT